MVSRIAAPPLVLLQLKLGLDVCMYVQSGDFECVLESPTAMSQLNFVRYTHHRQ